VNILTVLTSPAFLAPVALALLGAAYKWLLLPMWRYVGDAVRVIEDIRAELHPNHGASLRDSINRIESSLSKSDGRWLAAMNLFPTFAVWESREDGSMGFVSRAFSIWTGRSGPELLNDGWMSMIHPDDRDRVRRDFSAAVREHRYYDNSHRYLEADDKTFFKVLVHAYPIFTRNEEYVGHLGIAMREDSIDICSMFTTCPVLQEWKARHA
jgi:PAS domain S-box-containing protein